MKPRDVDEAIEACSVAWVTKGLTVRSLAPAESIRARNLQAQSRVETIIPETITVRPRMEPFWEAWVDKKGRCADKRKGDVCEICGKQSTTVYDHCHKSEIFRGWLCGLCNSMLGFALDNTETLREAANYLENFNKKRNSENPKDDGISLPSSKFEQRI